METWMYIAVTGLIGWLVYKVGVMISEYRIRKALRPILDQQIKRYDEVIKLKKTEATEAVNEARKAHEEYLVVHPDDFDANKPRGSNR